MRRTRCFKLSNNTNGLAIEMKRKEEGAKPNAEMNDDEYGALKEMVEFHFAMRCAVMIFQYFKISYRYVVILMCGFVPSFDWLLI